MTDKTAILIPARYDSTRFPGKPLCDLGGKTLIHRVYEKCAATGLPTYVLTDHKKIVKEVAGFGGEAILSGPHAKNGTERCRNALGNPAISQYDNLINVQGDMPDVDPRKRFSKVDIRRRVKYGSCRVAALAAEVQSRKGTPSTVHNRALRSGRRAMGS